MSSRSLCSLMSARTPCTSRSCWRASRAAAWRSSPASTCALRRGCGRRTRRPDRAGRGRAARRRTASRCRRTASSATSSRPMPSTARRRAGEVLVDERLREADGLEDLRAAVRLVGGDAHLRHHLEQALADRLDVALDELLRRRSSAAARPACRARVAKARFGWIASAPKPARQREVVHLARAAGLDDEAGARAQARAHQVVVHGGGGEQRRDRRCRSRRHLAVGEDDDVGALAHRVLGVGAELRERGLHAVRAPLRRDSTSRARRS